jgi:hypothetical protein
MAVLVSIAAACSSGKPAGTDSVGGRAGAPGGGPAPPPTSSQSVGGDPYPDGPAGPYGTQVGDTLPNLDFVGRVSFSDPPLPAASYEWKKLTFDDLHKSGKRYALVFFPAVWCAPCKSNAEALGNQYPPIKEKGGLLIQVLVDGNQPDVPATQRTTDAWAEATAVSYSTVMDPEDKALRSKAAFGWDRAIVIDLATMKLLFWGTPGDALDVIEQQLGL